MILPILAGLSGCAGNPSGPGGAGSKIEQNVVFASSRDGDFDIYAMNDDGSNVVRLTDLAGQERRPRWSPDGTRIAFDHLVQFDRSVYLMNADGSALEQVWSGFAPTWSPDGEEIAYSTGSTIWIRAADGSGRREVAYNPSGIPSMDWRPHGRRIAYTSGDSFLHRRVWLVDADDPDPEFWSDGAFPSWSHDGTRLAAGIPVLRVWDGLESTVPSWTYGSPPAASGPPAWSPDGTELLFVHDSEILRIDVGGDSPHVVVAGPGSDLDPDWR